MIDIIKQTPSEYSKQSRDYQVISRLYTALFNMNKMYADNLSVWNNDIDNKLTLLRAKTLNFNPKHSWDLDSLEGVVSSFKYLIRNKGTKLALEYCTTILMRINKLSGVSEVSISDNNIIIKLPKNLASIGVLRDLFDYIIPAGMTYRIIEYKLLDANNKTKISSVDSIVKAVIDDANMGIYNRATPTSSSPTGNQGDTLYHNIVGENINA